MYCFPIKQEAKKQHLI